MEATSSPTLTPVRRQALSDAVFEQLRSRIVSGDLEAGSPLPSERALCDALRVNRSSVREALRRLEQARLVSVRHGGTSRVLDYRETAGLDLLSALLTTDDGRIDAQVVRGVLEMRSAIAADAARLAASRAGRAAGERLTGICLRMRDAAGELVELQDLAIEFWSEIIDSSANIAYRLAYNSLRETYDVCREVLANALAEELRDCDSYLAIAEAVGTENAEQAEARARSLVRRGEAGIKLALESVDPTSDQRETP